jgi:N-succinyldiaminopimelate aminotransferase
MSSPSAARQPSQSAKEAVESRSPFVRLTELIAGIPPGKPVINLSVGEPQHQVPDFVAPVLSAHIADFGRYPANKGIEPFRKAVGQWLSRRFALPRAVDPETEVLVLNGTREGLFLPLGLPARRCARGAHSKSVLRGLCGRRAGGRLRAGLHAGEARKRLPP